MSEDWRLLGEGVIIQSVPGLAKQCKFSVALPEERTLYGLSMQEFIDFAGRYERILRQLFHRFGVSWNDVYANSDVGKERLMLADRMGLDQDDCVLDVGCGRGFFTIAAAYKAGFVTGLDIMNGLGRIGWWQRFKLTMKKLRLCSKVVGVKGNASRMPFKDRTFSVVSSVHAIRNFQDAATIQDAFGEMGRVVRKGGRVIIVETLPIAKTKAQEAHIKMFNCKVKYGGGELPYLSEEELANILKNTCLRTSKTEIFDFNLSAAPPFFPLNISRLPAKQKQEAAKEYSEAAKAIMKHGETSPPTLAIEATVE